MISLSPAMATFVTDLIEDALTVLDEEIARADEASDTDEGDERADLIEEHEQAVRLRESIVAQINNQPAPIWECQVDGCGWLNRAEETLCEQCGTDHRSLTTRS